MKPYIRWSKPPSQPLALMCVGCGAVRPSLWLPVLETDPLTRTFLPLLLMGFAGHMDHFPENDDESGG